VPDRLLSRLQVGAVFTEMWGFGAGCVGAQLRADRHWERRQYLTIGEQSGIRREAISQGPVSKGEEPIAHGNKNGASRPMIDLLSCPAY
jgi:hypothetical protein